jgi:hypothetical protein
MSVSQRTTAVEDLGKERYHILLDACGLGFDSKPHVKFGGEAKIAVFLRTEYTRGMHRKLVIRRENEKIVFHGDPAKAVAVLLLFKNSVVGAWGKSGLEVEAPADVYETLKLLSKCPPTWKNTVEWKLVPDTTPEKVRQFVCTSLLFK